MGGGVIGITPNAAGNGNDLSPEQTRQKEVGVKSDWLGENLSTTLAVYELELYNRRTSDPQNPGITLLSGLQRSRGVELTGTGRIVGNWYLRGGLGLQDATIVKDNNGFEGKRVSNVAKRNASLFLTWKPEMGWYAETGLTLVGDRYADNANTVVLPGYGTWDALAGFRNQRPHLLHLGHQCLPDPAGGSAQPGGHRHLQFLRHPFHHPMKNAADRVTPGSGVFIQIHSALQNPEQRLQFSLAEQARWVALNNHPTRILGTSCTRSIAFQPLSQNVKRLARHRQGMRNSLAGYVHLGALLIHERLTYSKFMTKRRSPKTPSPVLKADTRAMPKCQFSQPAPIKKPAFLKGRGLDEENFTMMQKCHYL